ncbi:hypothetical protein [Aestuariispira insulae]|uniref:Nucleotide-diphospho-sugar transferase n=1 Tax=Aestuariispira insulae TaxID=1461337 RepID=A0A3D9HE39_9PROT|nr:hypothetical protein [Aestuariispira insulae]RED47742.1 hypothetical protein DFP90_109106 [Aestuariispira insulae]
MQQQLEHLLEKVQTQPQDAENWVRLMLFAIAQQDRVLLTEVCALRQQLFQDAALLLFQTVYSTYAKDNPTLLQALPAMVDAGGWERSVELVLAFFAGCQEIARGAYETGLARWQRIDAAASDHGPLFAAIPHLAESRNLAVLFNPREPRQDPLPELQWLPGPQPDSVDEEQGPVFLASCDGRYFDRFGTRFIEAIRAHGWVHLHIADPTDDQRQQLAALAGPGVSVTVENTGSWRSSTYYASMRFLRAGAIRQAFGRDLMILDVDIDRVSDLGKLQEMLTEADVGLFDSGLILPWLKYQAAFVFLRAGPEAGRFLECLTDFLLRLLPESGWFVDQSALLMTVNDMVGRTGDISIKPLCYLDGFRFDDYFQSAGSREEKHRFRRDADDGLEVGH